MDHHNYHDHYDSHNSHDDTHFLGYSINDFPIKYLFILTPPMKSIEEI